MSASKFYTNSVNISMPISHPLNPSHKYEWIDANDYLIKLSADRIIEVENSRTDRIKNEIRRFFHEARRRRQG